MWCNGARPASHYPMSRTEFQLRISNRARRMRIDVSVQRGVVVVVPEGTPDDTVRRFVDDKRGWIDRARDRVAREAGLHDRDETADIPARLKLRALGTTYEVDVHGEGRPGVVCTGSHVRVRGTADAPAIRARLVAWLKRHARAHLPERLAQLAHQHDFDYQRVAIRGQRTRWASCSGRGTISLNYKLLFLPPNLVDHVLLHELAHTRHLDHSHGFWRLLERIDPEFRTHHEALARAQQWLPAWIDLEGAGPR